MRLRTMSLALLLTSFLILGTSACQETIIYVVLSPTPTSASTEAAVLTVTEAVTEETTLGITDVVSATAQVTAADVTEIAGAPTTTALLTPVTLEATVGSATSTAVPTSDAATPLPPNFPTPFVAPEVGVAEQLFERGRMFWLEPNGQIWVLVITEEGRGTWAAYEDTFSAADPESDPSLTPPADRLQPVRGFGKLWRENVEVRDALGWAVTPEYGYNSAYEYHAGGTVDANGVYTQGPGYHILYSLYSERFRFNEADNSWQLGG